jgi:serine/threonine protein kinase
VITKIDKGAHGQILQARDLNDNKDVAIKVMPRDEKHKNKYIRELNIFKSLDKLDPHPIGFPSLIYTGHTLYFYYYVMEMLGCSLK